MKNKIAAVSRRLVKFVVPLAILAWLFWHIDPAQREAFRDQPKNIPLLLSALGIATSALLVSFLRWAMLVRSQGIPIGLLEAFRLGAIGYLLSFVSAGSVGGDLFKAFFLAKRSPGKRFEAVSSVVVDRMIGLYGLFIVVSFFCVALPQTSDDPTLQTIFAASTTLAIVATLGLAAMILGGHGFDRLLRRAPASHWFGALVHRVADPLRLFHDQPLKIVMATGISIVVHTLLTISVFFIAKGLYSDPPSLSEHFRIVPIGILAAAVPITPAGLGVFEAALEWLYTVVPAQETEASGTMVALTFEIVKIIVACGGVLFYWLSRAEIQTVLEEANKPDSQAASHE